MYFIEKDGSIPRTSNPGTNKEKVGVLVAVFPNDPNPVRGDIFAPGFIDQTLGFQIRAQDKIMKEMVEYLVDVPECKALTERKSKN